MDQVRFLAHPWQAVAPLAWPKPVQLGNPPVRDPPARRPRPSPGMSTPRFVRTRSRSSPSSPTPAPWPSDSARGCARRSASTRGSFRHASSTRSFTCGATHPPARPQEASTATGSARAMASSTASTVARVRTSTRVPLDRIAGLARFYGGTDRGAQRENGENRTSGASANEPASSIHAVLS